MSSMGSPLLFLACLASIVPLALCHWMALGSADSNHVLLGLTLLPWMALVGLPGGRRSSEWRTEFSGLFVLLPIVALAWGLDRQIPRFEFQGSDGPQALLLGALVLAGLKFASVRAGSHSRWHAGFWALLVPGAAVFSGLLSSFSDQAFHGSGFISSEVLASWSPLSFCLRLSAGDASLFNPVSTSCLAASVAVLIAASEFDRRRR